MTDARKALESARPQLYLDCDGVLADFDRAFEAQFGHAPRAYEEQNGPKVFWRNIREEAKEFYRHLPLMPGAQELYDAVKHLRPIILTGCPLGGWAELQKIEWAREHFPGVPLIPCMSKDKRNYCQPGDALVDDYLKYRDLWQGAGGVFIHHTDVATSIEAVASWNLTAIDTALASGEQGWRTLQSRVQPWMMACFGPEISADKLERSDRFIEEALELVQAGDYPKERALALVDYVYGRDQGEINQEVGGVMITLAAHCLAHGIDMHEAGETELARIWTKVDKIRAKQAAKPTGSALPIAAPPAPETRK